MYRKQQTNFRDDLRLPKSPWSGTSGCVSLKSCSLAAAVKPGRSVPALAWLPLPCSLLCVSFWPTRACRLSHNFATQPFLLSFFSLFFSVFSFVNLLATSLSLTWSPLVLDSETWLSMDSVIWLVVTTGLHPSVEDCASNGWPFSPHLAVTDNAFVAACTDWLSKEDSAGNSLMLFVFDCAEQEESTWNTDRTDFVEWPDCWPDDDAFSVLLKCCFSPGSFFLLFLTFFFSSVK